MAKMAMGNAPLFAAVLKIPQLEEVIRDLDTLLVTCNSKGFINVPKFREGCENVLQTLYDDVDLAWNMTNPTVCSDFFNTLEHKSNLKPKIYYRSTFFLDILQTSLPIFKDSVCQSQRRLKRVGIDL